MNEDRNNLEQRDVDTRTATKHRHSHRGEIDDSQRRMIEEENAETVLGRSDMDIADDDLASRGRNDLGAGE